MSSPMFVKSARIEKAVSLINHLNSSKFPLLLSRILQKLHLKEEIFTKEESSKLEISLSVDQQQLRLILQTLTFIFQQAAYLVAKPSVLSQQLQQIEINDEKISAIAQAWMNNAKFVLEKLKQKSIAPKQLCDVNWELRLQLGQTSLTKMKNPLGLIELTLESSEAQEKVQMEFSHKELYAFYNQMYPEDLYPWYSSTITPIYYKDHYTRKALMSINATRARVRHLLNYPAAYRLPALRISPESRYNLYRKRLRNLSLE